MTDGAPTLGVGFAIDAAGSFDTLTQLGAVMDSTEARIVRDAAAIERATAGMVNVGAATARLQSFGSAATRVEETIRREKAQTERSIEGYIKKLDAEAAAVGRTRAEQRDARIEELAIAAARQGNTDASDRLLASTRKLKAAQDALAQDRLSAEMRAAAEAARERERAEAAVVVQLRERANLEAALARTNGADRPRATDAGATFSALAARAAEDEARALALTSAAAKQAADEHARLAAMVRGSQSALEADAAAAERLRASTDPLYAATRRLNDEIAESTRLYYAGATAPGEYARQQQVLAERLREVERAHDAAAGGIGRMGGAAKLSRGDMLNLGYQINDVVVSLVSGQKPFMVFAQQGAQIGQIAASSGVGIGGMARSLVALAAPFAPLIGAMALAGGGLALFDRAMSAGIDTTALVNGLGLTRAEIKRLENTSVTSGDVIKATFQVLAKSVGLDLANVKTWFGDALDWMTTAGRKYLAVLLGQFSGTFSAISAIVKGVFAGKGIGEILNDAGAAFTGEIEKMDARLGRVGANIRAQIASNKKSDLERQAAEIKADRAPKVDRTAERLAREARATEAQIRNLYALTNAYEISGAAALIAEARVKAESQAIKQRGDTEAAVDRQVRLSIAQRIADAAKGSAAMRDQARIQTEVNGVVAAGNIPSERASELVQQRMAELPLLAALEAAQQRGLKTEVDAATRALEGQRNAQQAITDGSIGARFLADDAAADRRLAELREEMRLVGATDAERVRALGTIRATNEAIAIGYKGAQLDDYVAKQVQIAVKTQNIADATRNLNEALSATADRWDVVAGKVQAAATGMADAFGNTGRALGDLASIYATYSADRARAEIEHQARIVAANGNQQAIERENLQFALRASGAQITAFGDAAAAAKGFFKEGSDGYKVLAGAEKAFRAVQFALSVRAMAQDVIETGSKLATSAARIAAGATEAVVNAIKSLPFPANLAAGAATVAALASIGVGIAGSFGGGGKAPKSNTGTGSVLGDSDAQSASIKRSIDALKEVDTLMLTSSRSMAASLRSIDSQIGGLASVLVRSGDINASAGVNEGFKTSWPTSGLASFLPVAILGKIPIIGDLLKSAFGTKTSVTGSGLFGGAQSVGSVLDGGFDAQTYSDVQKKKKLFGITTGTSYSTKFADADAGLEQQFTLVLRSFYDAIGAAAGPLGEATGTITSRLAGFVVDIGRIDLQGLTGEEIQEKLEAVFGAAADGMASAAFPGVERFQKVGEGAFETLVRVASTLEAVSASLDLVGGSARAMGIDAKLGLADQFDSIGDLTSAVDGYFTTFYTKQEQSAARAAQIGRVFDSLGVAMPATLDGFRRLVEAQNLTTTSGQATYATLLQLAPAFADLKSAMDGAKSAADILAERQDLERKLLETRGDTAALRALDLAKLDASNRGLQQQIYAVQDAQEAAKAAESLRDAWKSVGDTIMDEVKRIRGITGTGADGSFAGLMGQFNAATASARLGDQDAAKLLPGLSQSLLKAAADVATSRQELERVQAQTASSLEATFRAISGLTGGSSGNAATLAAAATASQATSAPAAANDDMAAELRAMREEIAGMRSENNAGHAANVSANARTSRALEAVTAPSGDAIAVTNAA